MKRKIEHLCLAACLAAAPCTAAWAEAHFGGGIEYFHWEEATRPVVEEKGPVFALHLAYAQDKASGALLGLRGRVWAGTVDYDGALLATNTPISGTTDYFGLDGEVQGRMRSVTGGQRIDGILALGVDSWNRQLTRDQSEQYLVLSLRLGFEIEPDGRRRGLLAGLGVNYPFYVYEDANFDDIGALNNPTLRPKGRVGYSAHLGFQIDERWRVLGYYDVMRLKASSAKFVDFVPASGLTDGFYYQPDSDMTVFGLRVEYRLQ